MTKKQLRSLRLPVFVQVRWVGDQDTVHMLLDRDLNTLTIESGGPELVALDEVAQIVSVLGLVPKWPRANKRTGQGDSWY